MNRLLGRCGPTRAPRLMEDSRVRNLVLVSATMAGSIMFCALNKIAFSHQVANIQKLRDGGFTDHNGLVPFQRNGQPCFLTKDDISKETWDGFSCDKARAMLREFDTIRCDENQAERLEQMRQEGLVSADACLGGGKLGRLMQVSITRRMNSISIDNIKLAKEAHNYVRNLTSFVVKAGGVFRFDSATDEGRVMLDPETGKKLNVGDAIGAIDKERGLDKPVIIFGMDCILRCMSDHRVMTHQFMVMPDSRSAADVEQLWMRGGGFTMREREANGFARVAVLCKEEDYKLVQSNYTFTMEMMEKAGTGNQEGLMKFLRENYSLMCKDAVLSKRPLASMDVPRGGMRVEGNRRMQLVVEEEEAKRRRTVEQQQGTGGASDAEEAGDVAAAAAAEEGEEEEEESYAAQLLDLGNARRHATAVASYEGTDKVVFWPPRPDNVGFNLNSDKGTNGHWGMNWPVKVLSSKGNSYTVQYDNGTIGNVLSEHVSSKAWNEAPVPFGGEASPLEICEFAEVFNGSKEDPGSWPAVVTNLLVRWGYEVFFPFHPTGGREQIAAEKIRRYRVWKGGEWQLIYPKCWMAFDRWRGTIMQPMDLKSICEEELPEALACKYGCPRCRHAAGGCLSCDFNCPNYRSARSTRKQGH